MMGYCIQKYYYCNNTVSYMFIVQKVVQGLVWMARERIGQSSMHRTMMSNIDTTNTLEYAIVVHFPVLHHNEHNERIIYTHNTF